MNFKHDKIQHFLASTSILATEGRVRPVGGGDGRLVLLGAGLVEDWQKLRGVMGEGLEVDHGVSPVPVVAVQDQVAMKVPGEKLQ